MKISSCGTGEFKRAAIAMVVRPVNLSHHHATPYREVRATAIASRHHQACPNPTLTLISDRTDHQIQDEEEQTE